MIPAPSPRHGRPRRLALFGGTFDPIHAGHLEVARSALRRLELDTIFVIPSSRPPHKPKQEMAPFAHRFAMVSLACSGHPSFVPSLAESGNEGHHAHYSIDTVRKFRHELAPGDRLYFILGVDQFLELPTWRSYEALLDSCDFIIASRPGFRMEALRSVIPPEKLSRRVSKDRETILLRKTAVHLLATVASRVSSTEIRRRRKRGESIRALVPPSVEEYILKQALYR